MRYFLSTYILSASLSFSASAKSLKDFKSSGTEEEVSQQAKQEVPQQAKQETPAPEENTTPRPEGNAEIIVDTGIAYTAISGSSGDWDSGFSGDFRVSYLVTKIMSQKLHLYGSYHFLPVDVIVTDKQAQYMGVVEQHLLGVSGRYILQPKLHLVGQSELGLATASLKPSTSVVEERDLRETGANILLSGGAQFNVLKKVWVGAHLSLAAGSFQTVQLGFSTSVTL